MKNLRWMMYWFLLAQSYWYAQSLATLRERLGLNLRDGPAKNVILFLGDGMSIATITAARIYMGQLNNTSGEEQRLSFEKFPYTGLSKTYCVNSQVADSACSGTAYLTGVKGNLHTIGVTADVTYQDWRDMQNQSLYTTSILQWAQDAGKGTGIVTTCKVTDASPTATYAHTASRWDFIIFSCMNQNPTMAQMVEHQTESEVNFMASLLAKPVGLVVPRIGTHVNLYWQTDIDIQHDAPGATGIKDITSQLIENNPGNNIKVIMGGGRQTFLPREQQDGYGFNGTRGDGKDLVQQWKASKDAAEVNGTYITNRDQLLRVDVNSTDYLLGLFHTYHMDYHLHADPTLQPTLAEMTSLAIRMMQKEANGYFLFIEGGRIDHGHHENKAHLALDETVEFHKAIEVAVGMVSEEDTLIVVTADHAHTMTLNGYPTRGSDIFTTLQSTRDNLTYSTLSYANGPNTNNFEANGSRHNIVNDSRDNMDYRFPTIFSLNSETHDGQDVAVYARGPCAHLLVGTYEQTVIPHVMGYVARIGPAAEVAMKSAGQYFHSQSLSALLLTTVYAVKLLL